MPTPIRHNFADIWETLTDLGPDAPAQFHADRTWSWAEFDRAADGLAAAFLEAGCARQDKVACYLFNGPEYLQTVYAAFKAGLVPVNTNYRYTEDELAYLWANADATVVVFHGELTERCERVRPRVPGVRTWVWVDDGTAPCPDWAVSFSDAVGSADGRVYPPWGRSEDDLLLMFTGGTTGMPKGVMWRQADLLGSLESANRVAISGDPLPVLRARVDKGGPRNLPAAPLMHGTGQFNAIGNLDLGGSVVTLVKRQFDVTELLGTIETVKVNSMSIVGDAFAKPILRALDAEPGRWDISSLRVVVSSGVMFSAESKAGLLRHNARLIMVDSLGSSEALSMASNTTTAESSGARTASFVLGPNTRVLTDDGRDVVPGSGERGRVALRGHTPIGYYKDPEKSAATFPVVDGVRYSVPGDWAEVDADGTVRLLGRGSQCINTGGEKVYPEEVEEVLKLHPTIADAAVVGLPDERFGEAITALVELRPGAVLDERDLVSFVKTRLAGYKAPKHVFEIGTVGRAANGKLDYRALKDKAAERSAG